MNSSLKSLADNTSDKGASKSEGKDRSLDNAILKESGDEPQQKNRDKAERNNIKQIADRDDFSKLKRLHQHRLSATESRDYNYDLHKDLHSPQE